MIVPSTFFKKLPLHCLMVSIKDSRQKGLGTSLTTIMERYSLHAQLAKHIVDTTCQLNVSCNGLTSIHAKYKNVTLLLVSSRLHVRDQV